MYEMNKIIQKILLPLWWKKCCHFDQREKSRAKGRRNALQTKTDFSRWSKWQRGKNLSNHKTL